MRTRRLRSELYEQYEGSVRNMIEPSNNGEKTSKGYFASGNKLGKGRPQGSRNKATLAMEQLLDKESEALTRKAIDMALGGDTTALRICMERLCPPRRDRPIWIEMPEMKSLNDTIQAMGSITNAVTSGAITPSEAHALADVIEIYRKTLETTELETRILALENGRMIKW